MNAHHVQPKNMLALILLVGASACDSGYKQIGSLDGAGATETGDNDDDNDPTADDGDGETGEACSDPGVFDCTEQDIDAEYTHAGINENQDLLLKCAANVEPIDDGYRVALTHCSNFEGDPSADRELILTGDWPEPELADGVEPLTEVHLISQHPGDDYSSRWAILRDLDHERVKLLAFEGTAMLIDPNDVYPLWLSVDEAACTPGPMPCTPETQFQEFPVGFTVGYGCAWGSVAHDTMITDFGIDEGTGTAYDVLVGFAVTHECYPDGDFQELQLGIVGKSVP